MELTIVGGATVDIATCNDLDRHHDKMRDMLPKKQEADYQPLFGSYVAVVGATTIAIPFNPGKPPGGKLWGVQWVSVFTTGFGGVIPNVTFAICIGNCPPPSNNAKVNPSDIVYPANSFPAAINVPAKTLIRPTEQLYVLLQGSGLVAGTIYNATAAVLETDFNREANLYI